MSQNITIDEPAAHRSPPRGCALWNLGFRPFYLAAGIFSALAIAIWVAHFGGWLSAGEYLRDPLWHAHEMIFGYTFAVVTGFLFTAVRNWTSRPTPSGKILLLIVSLWLEARLLVAFGLPVIAMYLDLAFAVSAALGIAVPLLASGNKRNQFFVAVLLAIGAANFIFTLGLLDVVALPPRRMLQVALDLMLFVMAVIGGRVIPMFTANSAPQAKVSRPVWLERLCLACVLVLLACDAIDAPAAVVAIVALVASLAHAGRLVLWQPWHTLRRPMLWILHASYAWIVVHLALRGIAAWQGGTTSPATHALTVGGIGGLTLGMMTRTARGHTGRPLIVERAEIACYVLIQIAATTRVLLPLAMPSLYLVAVSASGIAWVVAFAIFVAKYAPILWRPRLDGKPG